ncbi:hypothetical protein GCM10010924_53280 [Rhizobium wenxiniae]|nr:hypothetical protein GCM10010924_53280 [Rhizobium wenxiniae]
MFRRNDYRPYGIVPNKMRTTNFIKLVVLKVGDVSKIAMVLVLNHSLKWVTLMK